MADKQEDRIQPQDIFNIRFYEKTWFHGSFKGMHYRIEGIKQEDGSRQLQVTTWPGPYNYDNTDESLKERAHFAFSNDGLAAVTDYLNQYHKEHF